MNQTFFILDAGNPSAEACDWLQMLVRMYQRWVDRRGWEMEIVDAEHGVDAGIRSCVMLVSGDVDRCLLERGVHRLCRISPFDARKRRHTSFASVNVLRAPESIVGVLDPKDLKIGFPRPSGAGGQQVGVIPTGVIITHLPTGLTARSSSQRSQHRNRDVAMRLLIAKVGAHGMQLNLRVRSYVLQPYQMVTCHCTGSTVSDVQSVLDGNLDQFEVAHA